MPLPSVAGTLVRDIDPTTWGLADGAAITFANSGLTPVNASPTFRANAFASGAPAVRTIAGTSGFAIPRPVQDDFTIYCAFGLAGGNGSGAFFYQNGAFIDGETGGSVNDFGVNLRADGLLCAGVGNPETSVVGTHPVGDGGVHIVEVRRVKATGRFEVWVDGVLDITFAANLNSLTSPANLYFGWGNASQRASVMYGRVLFYDAAHSDSDRALVRDYLAATYYEYPGVSAQKLVTYAAVGALPEVMLTEKLTSYAVLGPGYADRLAATKLVSYGVLTPVARLVLRKAVTYAVVARRVGLGEYDGVLMACSDRPMFNVFGPCGERPASVIEPCGARPDANSFRPGEHTFPRGG